MPHTPGPWTVYKGELRPNFPTSILEVQDSKGRAVVPWTGFDACDLPKRQKYANALLIAAAPALLEAAKAVIETGLPHCPSCAGSHLFEDDAEDAMEGLRGAIAQAETGS